MAREILKNNSTLEITGNTGVKISTETIDSGEPNERKRFNISGKVQLNKPTTIGTLKLTAAEARRFMKAPGINKASSTNIELNSNLRLSLVNIERNTSNNITEYLYDLVYTAKENINRLNKLDYVLENKTIKKITKVTGIDRVNCGQYTVAKKGENRRISIQGTPGTTFKIAIVKNQIIRNTLTTGEPSSGDRGIISSIYRTDILNSKYSNGSVLDGEFTIIDEKLNSRGTYSFFQNFGCPHLLKGGMATMCE